MTALWAYLQPVRQVDWVVYAKRPFSGPEAVLAYLSQYTHRVAISNRRLITYDANTVTFKWKDYRVKGYKRYSTMTLATDEFIRRFLDPHPPRRLPPYPALRSIRQPSAQTPIAASTRATRLRSRQGRRQLGWQAPPKPPTFVCRTCGVALVIIEVLDRPQHARAPPM